MSTARRVLGQLLDHAFDALPALMLLGFLVATSHPFVVTFELLT
jgi:hypothetical protein